MPKQSLFTSYFFLPFICHVIFITNKWHIDACWCNSERFWFMVRALISFLLAFFFRMLFFSRRQESDNANLESNIRWADAFILMYSVTDKCSFDEVNRLKFLINYNKRRKKIGSNGKASDWINSVIWTNSVFFPHIFFSCCFDFVIWRITATMFPLCLWQTKLTNSEIEWYRWRRDKGDTVKLLVSDSVRYQCVKASNRYDELTHNYAS